MDSVAAPTVSVHLLWMGAWDNRTATQSVLRGLVRGLSAGSPYYKNLVQSYWDGLGAVGGLTLGSEATVAAPAAPLTDSGVWAAVSSALSSRALPTASSDLYFVLPSASVAYSAGACSSFCGWHSYAQAGGAAIKFGLVLDSSSAACGACRSVATPAQAPNGDVAGDSMASVLAHEMAEALTDPLANGWYDAAGNEVGDLCAWNFVNASTAPGGAISNLQLSTGSYLVQALWKGSSGACAMA